jgi:hypothetical protein
MLNFIFFSTKRRSAERAHWSIRRLIRNILLYAQEMKAMTADAALPPFVVLCDGNKADAANFAGVA